MPGHWGKENIWRKPSETSRTGVEEYNTTRLGRPVLPKELRADRGLTEWWWRLNTAGAPAGSAPTARPLGRWAYCFTSESSETFLGDDCNHSTAKISLLIQNESYQPKNSLLGLLGVVLQTWPILCHFYVESPKLCILFFKNLPHFPRLRLARLK